MRKDEGHYGSVPRSRRPLMVGALVAVAVIVVVAGLIVNWTTGTSVHWGWLLVAAGFVVGVYALYLWIRLSD